jgi:hypothetical protein
MPAIRLADIPNAGPQALGPSGNLLSPSAPQLTGAAALDPNALAGVAKQMQLDTYNLNAFSGEAAGLANMGDALGDVATIGFRFSRQMQDAKDDADYQQAKTVLEATWQKQLRDQETVPFAKWGENFQKHLATAQTALSEIKFSNRVAGKINQEFGAFAETRGIMINGLANKRQIEDYQKVTEIAYKRELANGNLEGAFSVINNAEKIGTYGKSDAETARLNVEIEVNRKSKAERNANLESAIILDPQNWERDLMEGLKTGSSKLQTDLSREEINRLLPYARQQSRVAEVDKMTLIEDMVLKGEFQTREELVKALEDKKRPDLMPNVQIPERAKQSLLATFEQSPEKQMESIKLIPAMIKKIESFDFSEDQNLEKYISLASEVRSLPEGYRKEPLDLLYDKFRDFKESRKPVPANALSQIKKMAAQDLDAGGYGKWETDENKLPTEATRKAYIEANLRYSQEMTALENWAKANPDKAKVDTEVYRAHNDIITQQNKLDAAAGRPLTRKPVDLKGVPAKPDKTSGPPDPDEVLRTAPKGASATSKPVGKVTYYNFPGDPYSDSDSRNLIGAWNNKLDKDSLAISPDIERKFKAAGIGKGDAVELTLADGSTVTRFFHDRTMQDEQAIRKFGKPLRGRFDFHAPDGKGANDGMAVVSFRKATAA